MLSALRRAIAAAPTSFTWTCHSARRYADTRRDRRPPDFAPADMRSWYHPRDVPVSTTNTSYPKLPRSRAPSSASLRQQNCRSRDVTTTSSHDPRVHVDPPARPPPLKGCRYCRAVAPAGLLPGDGDAGARHVEGEIPGEVGVAAGGLDREAGHLGAVATWSRAGPVTFLADDGHLVPRPIRCAGRSGPGRGVAADVLRRRHPRFPRL